MFFCILLVPSLFVLRLFFVFSVFPLCCLVVSISAIDCLERLGPEMTYYMSSGTLNPTHSLKPCFRNFVILALVFSFLFAEVLMTHPHRASYVEVRLNWRTVAVSRNIARCGQDNLD